MMLFIGLFITLILGFLILSFWEKDFIFWEKVFLGFWLGIGLVTLFMFALGVANISLWPRNIFLPLIVIEIFLSLTLVFKKKIKLPLSGFKLHPLDSLRRSLMSLSRNEIIFLSIIFFLIAWSFLATIGWPPYEWDALALYDFRGRVFAETHSLAQQIFSSHPQIEIVTYNYSYPFFTSLTHALVYLLGKNNPQFLYTLWLSYLELAQQFF